MTIINLNDYSSFVVNGDWTPALQKANDDIVASAQHKAILIPFDITIYSTFFWDTDYVSLKGNGAKINVDINNANVSAIHTRAHAVGGTPPTEPQLSFTQATTVFEGLKLVGKAVPTCKGISYDAEFDGTYYGAGASHISIREAVISGFIYGEEYLHSSYMISHYNVDICDNDFAIVSVDLNDTYVSGERIVYTACNIYNNKDGLYINNPHAEFSFYGCSLDFCHNRVISVLTGKVYLYGCHTENLIDDYSGDRSPFYIAGGNGAFLGFNGGSIQFHYPATSSQVDYIFINNAIGKGGLVVENCALLGLASKTGFLVGGTGNSVIKDIAGNEINNSSLKVQDINNLLSDGIFQNDTISDDIYIFSDTTSVQPYSRTGQNIALSLSTDTYMTTKSLKATKAGGSGSEASFIITVPISKNGIPFAEMFFRKFDPLLTGNLRIHTGYFRKLDNGQRVRFHEETQFFKAFGSEVSNWEQFYAMPKRKPVWATHYYIYVNMTEINGNARSIYFDNLYVGEM